MSKRSPKIDAPPDISVKREIWKNGAYSVARDSLGHWITTRKWHGKKDTEEVKTYVVYIQTQPEKKYRKLLPKKPYGYNFNLTGIRPEKYVYLMQSHFGKEYRCFSMTSSEIYTMNENTKEYLFEMTKKAYIEEFKYPDENHFENLRLLKIYDSRTMETLRSY
jgi:hypothetical protein